MRVFAAPKSAPALFRHVEELQGVTPWGSFLDAGTGTHSISWIGRLHTKAWTAVSGAEAHALQVDEAASPFRRQQDRIVVGNWADDRLLRGERYDTVLADYLLGAIEGFAPYFQEFLFARLRPLVRRRLYVVGLEPYVCSSAGTGAGKIVSAIGSFRDSCLLLAHERPYREYPLEWVLANLRAAGYRVLSSKRFGIRYKQRFVNSQIDMALMRVSRLEDRALAAALVNHGELLRKRALAYIGDAGALPYGYDYVVAAEPA